MAAAVNQFQQHEEIRKLRAKAIYDEDKSLPVRKSHENRHVIDIYNEFLTDGPCGHIIT
ncbi:MAG: iron hydrogenase small subunit [Ignavibacteriales bacterium]|nr:iron hydrogenase small subunit [Ignavibacteriales bacterium]